MTTRVTVLAVDRPVYYRACRQCHHKVHEIPYLISMKLCKQCNSYEDSPAPRYRLALKVSASGTSLDITIFGHSANGLFGLPAAKFFEMVKERNVSDGELWEAAKRCLVGEVLKVRMCGEERIVSHAEFLIPHRCTIYDSITGLRDPEPHQKTPGTLKSLLLADGGGISFDTTTDSEIKANGNCIDSEIESVTTDRSRRDQFEIQSVTTDRSKRDQLEIQSVTTERSNGNQEWERRSATTGEVREDKSEDDIFATTQESEPGVSTEAAVAAPQVKPRLYPLRPPSPLQFDSLQRELIGTQTTARPLDLPLYPLHPPSPLQLDSLQRNSTPLGPTITSLQLRTSPIEPATLVFDNSFAPTTPRGVGRTRRLGNNRDPSGRMGNDWGSNRRSGNSPKSSGRYGNNPKSSGRSGTDRGTSGWSEYHDQRRTAEGTNDSSTPESTSRTKEAAPPLNSPVKVASKRRRCKLVLEAPSTYRDSQYTPVQPTADPSQRSLRGSRLLETTPSPVSISSCSRKRDTRSPVVPPPRTSSPIEDISLSAVPYRSPPQKDDAPGSISRLLVDSTGSSLLSDMDSKEREALELYEKQRSVDKSTGKSANSAMISLPHQSREELEAEIEEAESVPPPTIESFTCTPGLNFLALTCTSIEPTPQPAASQHSPVQSVMGSLQTTQEPVSLSPTQEPISLEASPEQADLGPPECIAELETSQGSARKELLPAAGRSNNQTAVESGLNEDGGRREEGLDLAEVSEDGKKREEVSDPAEVSGEELFERGDDDSLELSGTSHQDSLHKKEEEEEVEEVKEEEEVGEEVKEEEDSQISIFSEHPSVEYTSDVSEEWEVIMASQERIPSGDDEDSQLDIFE